MKSNVMTLEDRSTADPPAVSFARRLQHLSRIREGEIGTELFADPAWLMLLDLFVSQHDRRPLSVTAVCISSNVPTATALRYLSLLQRKDIVTRIPDPADARRSYVRLTEQGLAKIAAILSVCA